MVRSGDGKYQRIHKKKWREDGLVIRTGKSKKKEGEEGLAFAG